MSLLKKSLKGLQKQRFVSLYAALKKKKKNKATEDGQFTLLWLHSRLAYSCRACRFELPMDMKQLEGMTIQEYLLRYCKIPRHRMNAYRKVFDRHKNSKVTTMALAEAYEAVNSILANTLEVKDIQVLLEALSLTKITVDLQLFSTICAVAERVMYCSILDRANEDGLKKSFLECADFSDLEWKLEGISVDPCLKRLLLSLG